MNVLVLEPHSLGPYSHSISQADIFFNADKRSSLHWKLTVVPRTNPAIVLILFPQLAPGCAVSLPQVLLHVVLSSKYVASHEGISRAWP